MKISKKKQGVVIAALIAITFFSFKNQSDTKVHGGVTVTEKISEILTLNGSKETIIIRDYRFDYFNSENGSMVLEKKSDK